MIDEQTKTLLKKYEFLLAGLAGTGIILFLLCFAARSSWTSGLKQQVENVLKETAPGQYVIGDFVQYDSSFTLNAAAFKLFAAQGRTAPGAYAVIAKIITIYGPAAGVFILEENTARFAGFASFPKRLGKLFDSPLLFSQIGFWEKKLPKMPFIKNARLQ